MESMFIKDIKKKLKKDSLSSKENLNREEDRNYYNGIIMPNKELLDSYTSIVEYNNVFIALISTILGSISMLLMGYLLILNITNSKFYFLNFLGLILSGIAVGVFIWGVKSVFEYSVWNGILNKDKDNNIFKIFTFFTIEGMSYLSYLIFLPFFLVFNFLFSSFYAGLILGGAIFFKFVLMYISYSKFLVTSTKIDRLILIFTSILAILFLNLIFKLLFIY